MSYHCPFCHAEDWIISRKITVWESFHVERVEANGDYQELNAGDLGDTEETGDWVEIECGGCQKQAPPDHPLWPTKEA